ncbi:Uncharacterised protein [[Clostridium] sordellii]|uniref:hypothetical protein n=1 Tax=Paraclostridium sordellii TaxID=1505 RepID=UPI0005DC40F3|nr:hypothetical protein [Paeniclostridium sordellii]CEQ11119.1 Uncharacterised protein [[Clostridium] sordellii] [Paeniclostridium sordellii]
MEFKRQSFIIEILRKKCSIEDIFEYGRMLEIDKNSYYVEQSTLYMNIEKFVDKVYNLGKEEELYYMLLKYVNTFESVGDRTSDKFGKLFNAILEKLSEIDEDDLELNENEFVDPIKFEKKMREKAKFNEDIITTGLSRKADISVLRRKAYSLDYKNYNKMTQRLARYYITVICNKYPPDEWNSNKRYRILYNSLIEMIPQQLFDADDDIEENTEGIIFDTIAKCLIFNE